MSRKLPIALLICSTRPSRFDDMPARWMLKQAQAQADVDVETVNLRDHPLPFFAEVTSKMRAPSQDPEAIRWRHASPSSTATSSSWPNITAL